CCTGGVRAWERFAMRWTDAAICVSDRERSLAVAGRLHGDLRVIPNGVDTHVAAPASWEGRGAARRALGLDDAPTAVCVGRLHHAKGQDVLVRAWPLVLRTIAGARLYLLGRGPEETALVDLAGPGVSLTGHQDDVRPWLAAADVVVVPSRWEGMSLAMLEAMAAARCVVTTDVSGAHEALGKTAGAIVPVEDVPALADAIVRRLTDPELARREGMAARARAERAFDLHKITAEVAGLYREIVQRAT
ncbi:MAG: glycosyltransferase family 4 protein, partial [Actinomycetota bacterium]|nr:glycosyltransferase family 4 protein [Actinomycetota bacterium]